MILKAYALLDTKVGAFGSPFFMTHEGYAIRAVMDIVKDMSTSIARHPFDYTLYEVGEFDDQLGMLAPMAPRPIVVAGNLVAVQPKLPLEATQAVAVPNGAMVNPLQEVM